MSVPEDPVEGVDREDANAPTNAAGNTNGGELEFKATVETAEEQHHPPKDGDVAAIVEQG